MLFYLLGSSLEERATQQTSRSIHALADLRPRIAHRIKEDGSIVDHAPCELQPGDRIRVFAGERVPLDGILESNLAQLDYSALTGESIPKLIEEKGEISPERSMGITQWTYSSQEMSMILRSHVFSISHKEQV